MFQIYKEQRITSPFGPRTLNGVPDDHKGVDVVGINNKTILSPIEGTVISSTIVTDKTNLTWQWGDYIRIDGNDKTRYFFCHMSKRLVKVGDKVKVGTPIGIEGNTGYSFGAHCHFEVRKNINGMYTSVDPVKHFMSMEELIKDYYGFDDNTIQYFKYYKYGTELLKKLYSRAQ